MDELRTEFDESQKRKEELESQVAEWKMKMQAWEEERDEEREAYERKLNEVCKIFE